MDLFFALSGFLITGILLDTQGSSKALRNFYVRRGLRIWPLYFLFLLLAFVALRRMIPAGLSPLIYAVFAQNFFYYANSGPLLDPTWSLAVEEQFYLVWPWIALRVRRETVLTICCAVLALSPVIRLVLRATGAGGEFLYANTLCRLDGIAMGGMIAASVRSPGFGVEALRNFVRWAALLGTAGTAICYAAASRLPGTSEARHSFVALAFGAVVSHALLAQGTRSTLVRVLRSSPVTTLGRISFALYLFNLPVYTVVHGHLVSGLLGSLPFAKAEIIRVICGNLLLLFVAGCSWKLYESPILRLKRKLAPRGSAPQ